MCWLMNTCEPDGDRDGVLQVAAHGQRRRHLPPDVHRQRRIAAGPAHHQLAAQHHPGDRVVHVPDDRPIVHEEQVGDAAQPRDDLGFVGHIGSSERLPLVQTSGRPTSAISR